MASVQLRPRHGSRIGQAGDDLRGIEHWFVDQGVPQFMSRYSPQENMPVLLFLLLTVVAFEASIQPWLQLSVWMLFVAPAVLIGIVLVFKVAVVDQITRPLRWYSRLIRLAVGYLAGALLGWLLAYIGLELWSDASLDFLVILVLLWVAAELFRVGPAVWDAAQLQPRRRRLSLLVAAAVVCFAFEGTMLPPSTVVMDGVVGSFLPGAVPVPQSLAALLVAMLIVTESRGFMRASTVHGVTGRAQGMSGFPAVPLLILLFCVETAVLPYVGPVWPETVLPLAGILAVVALQFLSRRFPRRRRWRLRTRWPRWLRWLNELRNYPGLILFIVVYLVAYPVILSAVSASQADFLPVGAAVEQPTPWAAFLLALGINVLYLGLAVVIAGFGLDQVAMWASREAWGHWRDRIFTLGRGIPILLVFTTFFLLSAEIWESMAKISTAKYLLLIGLLLGLTGAFHLLTSLRVFPKRTEFRSWSDVTDAAKPDAQEPLIQDLLGRVQLEDDAKAPTHALSRLERVNGIIILMTYEILVFIPVMVLAGLLFFALGHLLVLPEIAATWIYGDGTPAARGYDLARLSLIEQPWTRVAALLAVFSVLYLAVEVLLDAQKHEEFFASADRAVRRRLAIRLVYHEVLEDRLTYLVNAQNVYLDFLRNDWYRTRAAGQR
jgi:hypothetical protein